MTGAKSSGSRGPLLLVLLVAAMGVRTTDAGLLDELIVTVVGKLADEPWRGRKITLFDRECIFLTRPTIEGIELRYKGRVWCPGWVPFDGLSSYRANPDHAHEEAVEKFIQKVEDAKLADPSEIEYWRKNH